MLSFPDFIKRTREAYHGLTEIQVEASDKIVGRFEGGQASIVLVRRGKEVMVFKTPKGFGGRPPNEAQWTMSLEEGKVSRIFSAHHHVATTIGYSVHPLAIIMQHYQHDTLCDLIYKFNEGLVKCQIMVVKMIREVADALRHIHECGWIHNDIKAENVLIGANQDAFLADFGVSIKSGMTPAIKPGKKAM